MRFVCRKHTKQAEALGHAPLNPTTTATTTDPLTSSQQQKQKHTNKL
jgi:hypothetical protein